MKKIKLQIQQYSINKKFGVVFDLVLHEEANVIDAINEVDEIINSKGNFPLDLEKDGYHSLLHMVYNPVEKRFYKQTAITAYPEPGKLLNVRNNPEMKLPDGVEVIIKPEGPCMSEWDDVIDYETFRKAILNTPLI